MIRKLFGFLFFIALLALAAMGGMYAGRNLTGIGPSPTRSAFAGRLPGIPEGDMRRFQFFYATNRADTDATFNEQGSELGKDVLTGTYDVLMSPYLQIKPFAWFDKESIKLDGRVPLKDEIFHKDLKKAVQGSPQKSLLVIVWGYRDWFMSAALKTAYTAYVLDINTPVLLFDWPGNQGDNLRGYNASRLMAAKSAEDLAHTLVRAIVDTGAENVWIMGSSLGCQTICDSLAWLSEQKELTEGKPKISNVVLNAPDVAANAFDDKFAERIQKISKHLTAYVSSNDRALLMSQWINRARRVGRLAEVMVPPEERTSEYEFEEGLELLELQQKGARAITVVDATPINLLRNLHHFFTDSPVFFDDLYQRLLQPDDIVSRRLHSVRTSDQGTRYYILWND